MEQRIIIVVFSATLPCPGEGGITPEKSPTTNVRQHFFQIVCQASVVTRG